MTSFGEFLSALIRQHGGSKQEFAFTIGVSPSSLSRLLHKPERPDLLVCLRIAWETSTPASRVLRAARHEAVVDLIEKLYGPPRREPVGTILTGPERTHLERWRALPSADRSRLAAIITRLIEADAVLRGSS